MQHTAQALAAALNARLIGNPDRKLSGVASVRSARPGDLVFVESEKFLLLALSSSAAAVIAGEFAAAIKTEKPLLICAHPRLAFARAAAMLCPPAHASPGVHATAVVSESTILGKEVSLGPHVVIGDEVLIGDHTQVGAGTVIAPRVKIGNWCNIAPNVTIYASVKIGDRVIVHAGAVLGSDGFGYVRDPKTGHYEKLPQIGGLEIGDDIEIGANTTIDRGALETTVIGRGTKLDNLVHVGHNVHIGEDVVIAAQTGLSGSAMIEDGAVIAGQVGIADHVRIEKGAILGAQCGVPSNKVIRGAGVVFWGTPARPIRQYLKELAVLAKLAKKI
jgi:UDP-3-O-[3-hydroxymyristoyl] glucosamine N-acyltransferase